VITVLALGNGARAAVEENFRFLGSDNIRITSRNKLDNDELVPAGEVLSYEDGLLLPAAAPLVFRVAMSVGGSARVRHERAVLDMGVSGVTAEALDLLAIAGSVQPVSWSGDGLLFGSHLLASGRFWELGGNTGARRPAGRVMQTVIDDGNGPVASRIEILPSPDLPDAESETSGVFLRRVDNSIFVGTGSIELNVQIEQAADGSIVPSVTLSSDGPEVEVVITRDTVLYKDVTKIPGQGGVPAKAGDTTVTQQIELIDTLDGLGGNSELQVWGTRRADRVVADIIIYGIVEPNLPF
jgi:hypothetical protein